MHKRRRYIYRSSEVKDDLFLSWGYALHIFACLSCCCFFFDKTKNNTTNKYNTSLVCIVFVSR